MDDIETPVSWNDSLETLVAEEAERCETGPVKINYSIQSNALTAARK